MTPVAQKIQEDGIVKKLQGQFIAILFPKRYKATGSLCDCLRKGRSKPACQALLTP